VNWFNVIVIVIVLLTAIFVNSVHISIKAEDIYEELKKK
jgi:hypothetical protein